MKLSRKSEYACLALIELAKNYPSVLVTITELSERNKIPQKYLEQILLLLKSARYVQSVRGVNGGYRLAKSPDDISVAEIIRLIDGPLAPVDSVSQYFYSHTPIEQSEKLLSIFADIRNYIANKLENTTFSDLIR